MGNWYICTDWKKRIQCMCNLVYSSKIRNEGKEIKMMIWECIIKWIEKHLLLFSLKDFWQCKVIGAKLAVIGGWEMYMVKVIAENYRKNWKLYAHFYLHL